MSVKLGEAVVYLLGNREGIEKDLNETEKKSLNWASNLGRKVTKLLGAVVVGGVAAAGAAIAGIGAAAFAAGNQMDEVMDTLRTSTGKTGEVLDGLVGDFQAVFTSIPTDAGPAIDAIAELNRRLGMTGPTLQDTSKNILEMSRLLGGDAKTNTALFTRVMGDWGIANEDAAGTLDKIFVASQETGVGVESLMQKVVAFGSPLRLMGFTLDDSIALFAKWEKEGVNAELVMGSLRIAAGKFAAEGKPLRESLLATFEAIQSNTNASAALALGMETFGARAGPDMVAAIREGRFSIDELTAALQTSRGAILETADATADFPEKLEVLKNTATVALAPLGLALMDIVTTLVERFTPAIQAAMPVIETLVGIVTGLIDVLLSGGEPMGDWSAWWEALAGIFGEDVATAITNIMSGIAQMGGLFPWLRAQAQPTIDAITAAFSALSAWWFASGKPAFDALVAFIQEHAQPILAGLAAGLLTVVVPAFVTWAGAAATAAASTIAALAPVLLPIAAIGAAVGLLAAAWTENWGGIQEKTAAVVEWIQTNVAAFLALVQGWWAAHGEQITSTVTNLWSTVRNAFQTAFEWIKNAVETALDWVRGLWSKHGEQTTSTVQGMWQAVQNAFNAAVGWLSNLIQATIAAWQAWWERYGGNVQAIWQSAWDIIKTIFNTILGVITNIYQAFQAAFEDDWTGFGTYLRKAWDLLWAGIQQVLEDIWTIIVNYIRLIIGQFQDLWTAFGDDLKRIWSDLWAAVWEGLQSAWKNILDFVRELPGKIISFFTDTDWGSVGRNIIQGIANGITAAVDVIKNAAREAARRALEAAKAFLGIHSPSSLFFHEIGEPISEGTAAGILAGIPKAVTAVALLAGALTREVTKKIAPLAHALQTGDILEPGVIGQLQGLGGGLAGGAIEGVGGGVKLPYDPYMGWGTPPATPPGDILEPGVLEGLIGGIALIGEGLEPPAGKGEPGGIGTYGPGIVSPGGGTGDILEPGVLEGLLFGAAEAGATAGVAASRSYGGGGGGGWTAEEKKTILETLAEIRDKFLNPVTVNYTDQRVGASDPDVAQIAADLEWQMRLGVA